jgi:transcriptional regulator with XRE-family HTH domain
VDAIGQRLKEERLRKGWSQRDLSRETGVNADTISGIETGQHEPRPSTLRRLTEGLGIEVRDLFAEPALPKAEAPVTGRPSIIDLAWDAARRQVALEKQAMFSGRKTGDLDQHYANEMMRRLREEYALDANDAEALVDFAKRHAYLEEEATRIREENATLRDRLQEREQTHS